MRGTSPRMTEKEWPLGSSNEVTMKICVAGQGAFGQKHLDALKRIPDVEGTSLGGGILIAADQRGDFDIGDTLERVEMFLPERALPRYANLHRYLLLRTAV